MIVLELPGLGLKGLCSCRFRSPRSSAMPWAWLDTFPSFLRPVAPLDGREEPARRWKKYPEEEMGPRSCTNGEGNEASREHCIPKHLSE